MRFLYRVLRLGKREEEREEEARDEGKREVGMVQRATEAVYLYVLSLRLTRSGHITLFTVNKWTVSILCALRACSVPLSARLGGHSEAVIRGANTDCELPRATQPSTAISGFVLKKY